MPAVAARVPQRWKKMSGGMLGALVMFVVLVELWMIYGLSPLPLGDVEKHEPPLPLGDVEEKHEPPPPCHWDSPDPFTTSSSSSSSPDDLLFVIPTVHREVDYFTNVLKSIDAQINNNNQYNLKIKILVVNNLHPNSNSTTDRPEHAVFLCEKQARAKDARFDFIQTTNLLPDVGDYNGLNNLEPDPDVRRKQNRQEHANSRVRQQTRDIVNSLRIVSDKYALSPPRFVILQEDDFEWCPQALFAFAYLGHRLDWQHSSLNWLLVRFSFGFNGVMLHGGRDVVALREYLSEHQARRPPDHLLVEWFAGETAQSAKYKAGRPHAAYRYNLLKHTGTQSSLRDANQPGYSSCWAPLQQPEIFQVEAFDAACSANNSKEDIWPCVFPAAVSQCPPWGGYNKV